MLVTNILLGIIIVVLFAILDVLCGRTGAYTNDKRRTESMAQR